MPSVSASSNFALYVIQCGNSLIERFKFARTLTKSRQTEQLELLESRNAPLSANSEETCTDYSIVVTATKIVKIVCYCLVVCATNANFFLKKCHFENLCVVHQVVKQ